MITTVSACAHRKSSMKFLKNFHYSGHSTNFHYQLNRLIDVHIQPTTNFIDSHTHNGSRHLNLFETIKIRMSIPFSFEWLYLSLYLKLRFWNRGLLFFNMCDLYKNTFSMDISQESEKRAWKAHLIRFILDDFYVFLAIDIDRIRKKSLSK